ncbi:3-carboxy-cis,cis-muconate cycloisomerase [Aliiruegeria sabulilitoris]|uniref:3-carboxy-cis,cis-muconate cycloisomerase n=1 Tax=Aliiruegeria sabulilitoris TaxID=1510458 RepID=UPI0008296CEB|nr:3-carboxy-cis,cis-muconate cycloisomerase [Aliiruegeria sabulilitoris]NDR56203.1 3-carboxy-cis,cis-muconate cycloisomerase [Pseudoruegeria sp. M32A2M]
MNPLTHEPHMFGPLFTDETISAAFSSARFLSHFSAFERALAQALGEARVVSPKVSAAAVAAIDSFVPDLEAIRAKVLTDGVPAPEYARQLKAHAGPDCLAAIHAGATSQDLVDTATVLALREVTEELGQRLHATLAALDKLDSTFGKVEMMGRTRMQAALPITVSDRIAGWKMPLATHLERLEEIRPRIEQLQFGGAVGNRAATGTAQEAVAAHMAGALGLNNPPRAWHAMRDGMAEYAGWLSLVTGTLGKMGQDLCLMAQQGVDELRLSSGGSSSAMPHKQNPVLAEMLVTLARYNAVQLGGMHQALLHEQERSGAAWTLEWMILPAMAGATGKALLLAQDLLGKIERLGPAR